MFRHCDTRFRLADEVLGFFRARFWLAVDKNLVLVSYGDSNLRGRSGKVNPNGGRIRGATGASNRRGRSAGRHNFCD